MAARKVAWVWLAVALQGAIYMVSLCAGQGFIESDSRVVGADKDYQKLEGLYSSSRNWRVSYKLNPKSACSGTTSSSLCAAAAADDSDALAQLMLAASPQVYSSLDARYTSGVRLVAPSLRQQPCDTCSAMAVASAAETAMASVYRVNVADCSISVQALHSCPPGNQPALQCKGGSRLTSTLTLLQQYSQQLPTEACVPYKPDQQDDQDRSELCGRCSAPNKYASQGRFASYQITTIWHAQRHIRRYGSVVTRFNIYDDFEPFFSSYANAEAIYKPKRGAVQLQGHAVVLVGYNNEQQYWIAKNSWGSDFADNGIFKVAFNVCSILTANGEAYGISWEPKETPDAAKIQLLPGPKPGCYWYKALRGDYMSRVAWLAGIPLDRFMMENVEYVKDLDASLEGVRLLVCSPKAGRFVAPNTSAQPVPSSSVPSDPQLEALLRIKSSVDKTNQLKDWTRESGAKGGYCKWKGVECDRGMVTRVAIYFPTAGSGLQGSLPPASMFAGLTQLNSVDISGQQGISGTLPSDWPQLKQLEDIRVANNSITGTMPADWAKLGSRLRVLMLWGNKLTGRIPDAYKILTALGNFDVGDNQLTGTIPAWLGGLSKLNKLYLHRNMFSGTIPDSLKGLNTLTDLPLASNQLTGTLPAVLGELTRLVFLDFGFNKLTGTLPDQYKALVALETFGVKSNSLVGTVPASWAGMTRLKTIWLGGNPALGGCLPKAWSSIFKSRQYDTDGTNITGPFC